MRQFSMTNVDELESSSGPSTCGAAGMLGSGVVPVEDKSSRRRCVYKRCRLLLPREVSSRCRYCGPNCVAGAYRLRRRRERAWSLLTLTIDAKFAHGHWVPGEAVGVAGLRRAGMPGGAVGRCSAVANRPVLQRAVSASRVLHAEGPWS